MNFAWLNGKNEPLKYDFYYDLPLSKLHRDDGPAIEETDGRKEWWFHGKLHRDDGPAIEHYNGAREWWQNGKLHRENGPALEYKNGTKIWYLNGQPHRENGPAVIWWDSAINDWIKQEWWLNGVCHRNGFPAIQYATGKVEWYLYGVWLDLPIVTHWLKENQFKKYVTWTEEQLLLFKLTWGGDLTADFSVSWPV